MIPSLQILLSVILSGVVAAAVAYLVSPRRKPNLSPEQIGALVDLMRDGTKLLHERQEMPWTDATHYTAWLDNLIHWEQEALNVLKGNMVEYTMLHTLGVFEAPDQLPFVSGKPFPQWEACAQNYSHQWRMHHRRLQIVRNIIDANYPGMMA